MSSAWSLEYCRELNASEIDRVSGGSVDSVDWGMDYGPNSPWAQTMWDYAPSDDMMEHAANAVCNGAVKAGTNYLVNLAGRKFGVNPQVSSLIGKPLGYVAAHAACPYIVHPAMEVYRHHHHHHHHHH